MRTLAKYLQDYKKESILAPFFKFLEGVFDLLVPIVIAQIIDVGIARNDHGYIAQRFFILILMAAAGLAVSITAQFFAAKASVGFAAKVRQAVFDHIQKLSYTELDTLGTDTLITRLTDDVNQVQNGVNMGLRLLLRSPFIVLGSMVMAFTINVRCALIFVVAIPVLFQDSRNTVCTGHRFVQGDDKGSKFDQFYDHLCHVVVKSNNFTLLHVSEINLNTRSLNQNDSCDVDQHIGSRI